MGVTCGRPGCCSGGLHRRGASQEDDDSCAVEYQTQLGAEVELINNAFAGPSCQQSLKAQRREGDGERGEGDVALGGCAPPLPLPREEEEKEARDLLSSLRAYEAAARLSDGASIAGPAEGNGGGIAGAGGESLRGALDLQLGALEAALECLREAPTPADSDGEKGPASPRTCKSGKSTKSTKSVGRAKSTPWMSGPSTPKRDVLEINFDLDSDGHRVEALVEFFPDGMASIRWTAAELPVPLPYIVCMVNEVDLFGEIAPFIESAVTLHQFPWNEADRLVRIVSRPPIPLVSGLEAVHQRFGFDLLDTPYEGFCMVDGPPIWEKVPPTAAAVGGGAGDPGGGGTEDVHYRGVPRAPPARKGLRQVDVKNGVALGRPVGHRGELTTITFFGMGDLKVPRMILPNKLITILVTQIGRFIFRRARERVAGFEASEHGARLRGSAFYATLHRRIAAFVEARAGGAAASSGEQPGALAKLTL